MNEELAAPVRRYYDQVVNQQNVAVLDTLLASNYQHNGEGRGVSGEAASVRARIGAFPDIRAEIVAMLAEGDQVAVRVRWRGTQKGTWLGLPATGRTVEWDGMAFHEVRDGRLAKSYSLEDEHALLRQMRPSGVGPR